VISSTLFHALLVLILLTHYGLAEQASYRRILPVLALVPLLRILSLTMPIKQMPQIYWYAMIGVPLLLAVALTMRVLNLSWTHLGLQLRPVWSQIFITLSGLPLSIIAFLLLQSKPVISNLNWSDIIIGSVILIIFSGFTEEIIFRGLLQQMANEIFGRAGILCSSALFAIMYMGSLSLSYILFIALVGLFFGWCVNRTGLIWGVTLGHSFLSIGALLIWPIVWPPDLTMPPVPLTSTPPIREITPKANVTSILASPQTPTSRPISSATPTPNSVATATPSPTLASELVVKVNETLTMPVNVRTGPSTSYPIIVQFRPGQEAPVTGRTADSSWWQVRVNLTNQTGAFGWMASPLVILSGNSEDIPIIEASPPPTPQPTLVSTP
jgi:membrane protease YdiL (CAAX protease family)